MPNQWGLVIISFIAIIVKLAFEHLWRTISFAIHQVNSSSRPRDNMYHQVQLLLRNAESEASFMTTIGEIWYAHQGARSRVFRQYSILFFFAAAHAVGFFAASGLSSGLVTTRENVGLIVSRSCGWHEEPLTDSLADDNAFEAFNALAVMGRNNLQKSAIYARNCYGAFKSSPATACSNFAKDQIPYTITRGIDCPFGDNICNSTGIFF